LENLIKFLDEQKSKKRFLHPFLNEFSSRAYYADIWLVKLLKKAIKKYMKKMSDNCKRETRTNNVVNSIYTEIKGHYCRWYEEHYRLYSTSKQREEICGYCLSNMKYNAITKEKKVIWDPVHGLISFDWDELLLVNTCYIQRLRNIIQTSFLYYVFPGSHHSRFEHSLGVTSLVKKVLKMLDLNGSLRKWSNAVLSEEMAEKIGFIRVFKRLKINKDKQTKI